MNDNLHLTRLLQATASTLVLVGLWQIASMFFPESSQISGPVVFS